MSEIRINILDVTGTISGTLHGSMGDVLIAALAAEPATIEELETAVERFIKPESDWTIFRAFRKHENFEPYDAGILIIDLAAKLIAADSTYSYYGKKGSIRIKTDTNEDFSLPYELSDDWKTVGSIDEFQIWSAKRRRKFAENPPLDAREILFGKPLFEFIAAQTTADKDSTDKDLYVEIHAEWLITAREDLRGKTPREVLLEKRDFISADLHSRFLQWSLTKKCPPPISKDSDAFRYAGFGTHEIVVYYDLFRYLLNEGFENQIAQPKILEKLAEDWLKTPQSDFSGRIPAKIIESERSRLNLTMSAHECVVDDDCEMCEMMALNFIDTPMFWGLDGSNMEYDRFEFSFFKTREEWEEEQQRFEDFNRKFAEREKNGDDFFDEEIIY